MRIWDYGKWVDLEIGQRVFIGKCVGLRSVWGEFGRFERVTKQHAVFISESGSIIKTAIDNLCHVAGGFGREGWWVSPKIDRVEGKDFMQRTPSYWNLSKCEICHK